MFRAPSMVKGQMRPPAGMPPQVLTDRWWLKAYGLTPSQVKELPLEDYVWFPLIDHAERVAEHRKNNK